MNQTLIRARTALFILALLTGLSVLSARWISSMDAVKAAPGTAETSGCEEESWLALWNHLNDRPVFRSATEAPFNFAYFNWGFYRSYGTVAALANAQSDPLRIISVGRSLTAFLGLIAAVAWLMVCRRATNGEVFWPLLPWATFPIFGPITGWMLVTVRPDVGALMFDALAVGAVVMTRERGRTWGLLLAGVAGYAAWSFKISQVGGLCTIGCFLIWRRAWRDLVIFCLPVFTAMGVTIWLGGDVYRHALFGSSFGQSPFHIINSLAAFKHFIPTGAPFFVGIAVAVIWPFLTGKFPQNSHRSNQTVSDAFAIGLIGSVLVTSMMALASSKTGSWTYYYMPATLPLALLGITLAYRRDVLIPASSATAIVIVILQTGLLAGWWGKISIKESSEALGQRWSVFSELPEPRFSTDLRLNLPWLNPHSPPLVLAYDYHTLRAAGVQFDANGLGGIIEREELNALLLPDWTGSNFDGTSLIKYWRTEPLNGWSAFNLKSK
jgi:hypothetical protein